MQQRTFGVGNFGQPIAALVAIGTLTASTNAGTYVPGTSEATVEAIEAQLEQFQNPRGTLRFTPGNRWPGTAGTPKIFTYSLAPDGTQINGEFVGIVSNSTLFARMNALFADDTAQWQAAISDAFSQWEDVSGLEFIFVSDTGNTDGADDGAMFSTGNAGSGVRGDIRIGMQTFPGGEGGLCAQGLRTGPGSVVNESQRISLFGAPTGGTFTLDWSGGGPTAAIAFNASSATVQSSLDGGIAGIAPGDINVTGNDGGPWTIQFIGNLGGLNVLSVSGDGASLTGGVAPSVDVQVLQEGGSSGDYGEIVLDSSEDWSQLSSGSLRFLTNCIAREIGTAVGLGPACPITSSKLMEPVLPPTTGFVGPQLDDVRAAHRLYGDTSSINTGGTLDENGTRGTAFPFDETQLQTQVFLQRLSLDTNSENDYYAFTLPEGGGEVSFTASPILFPPFDNGSYLDGNFVGGVCDAGVVIDTFSLQDLQIEIQDAAGIPIPLASINDNGLGAAESIVGFDIPGAGTYFLVVSQAGGGDAVQMYSLLAEVRTGLSPSNRIIHMDQILPEINFQALAVRGDVDATGDGIVIGNIEGGLPWLDHAAFIGGNMQNVVWGGTDPASTFVTDHATAVVGTAVGQPDSDPGDEFTGIAPNANIVSSTIATSFDQFSGFAVSNRALLFSLFALTDEDYMTGELGLPRAASVLNLSWGASGGDLTGESFHSRFIDAVVAKRGVLAVIAAGNRGTIDDGNFCGDGDPEAVGGRFIGSRTVTPPATAFNAFSVGAVGTYWKGTGGAGGPNDGNVLASDKVAYFSSRGPIDSFDMTPDALENIFNTRPGIHIVAQGTGLVIPSTQGDPRTEDACPYLGDWFRSQSIDLPWIDPDDISPIDQALLPNPDQQFFSVDLAELPTGLPGPPPDPGGVQGTSFAAPLVAGVAALLQDAALKKGMSINSLVLRSIMMTGARKAPGWSNNGLPSSVQMTRDGQEVETDQVIGTQIATTSTLQPLDFLQGAGVLNVLRSMQIYFGQLNIPEGLTQDEVDAIQANPQPHNFFPFLHDSPLTNPTKPTVTRIDTFIIPDPFPGTPGDVTPQDITPDPSNDQDNVRPTPLQIAKALHEASKTVNVGPRMRNWADVDPVIGIPDPGGSGGDIGGAPIEGVPFDPDPFGGELPPPFPPRGEEPRILDDVIQGGRSGWDIANVGMRVVPGAPPIGGQHGFIDYRIGPFNIPQNEFGTVEVITATLVWDRNVKLKRVNWQNSNFNPEPAITALELENLDLELHQETGDQTTPIFISNSTFNNVEHIYVPLPVTETPLYFILRVRWIEQEYDLTRENPPASVKFALSWRSQVFNDLTAFEDSLSVDESAPTSPVIPPMSPATISHLVFNLGATDSDPNYDAAYDMDSNGVFDVLDISYVLFRLRSDN